METTKTIQTSDGKCFSMSHNAAMKFGIIRNIQENGISGNGGPISVPAVNSECFSLAAEWATIHSDSSISEAEITKFDSNFGKNFGQQKLHDLMLAADFLDAPELIDILAARVAALMKGKTYLEIRQIFNIKPDFAPGEEEAIIKRNPWAFE